MTPKPIEYQVDDKGTIHLPKTAPFDGSEVLIKLSEGWVQAHWMDGETTYDHEGTPDVEGFCWVCLDDGYQWQELDAPSLWCPLPDHEIT
jgi:hypothetical protein